MPLNKGKGRDLIDFVRCFLAPVIPVIFLNNTKNKMHDVN